MTEAIKDIHALITNIKNEQNYEGINNLLQNFIRKKIDVERTKINNIDNIAENVFGNNGTIV